jgi:predicted ATPase
MLELRASAALARLWAERGELKKAFDVLAPIYDWFTEGFDTPDLHRARTLLDELRLGRDSMSPLQIFARRRYLPAPSR